MRWSIVLALVVLGCSNDEAASAPADTGVEDDAGKPPIDPARFDCSSLAKGLPVRKSTVPESCLRDPKCTTRLVSGHRGAGGDLGRIAPEDTLAAYRAAVVMGLDIVETDPRPTSDGVMINMHDPTVNRTTNGTGEVSKMTFDAIRALKLKTDLPGDWSCEKVPTFTELLQLTRGRALTLVDANKTDRVDLLVKSIHDADALDWAVFDTSSLDKIDQALALEPKLMIMPRIEDPAQAATILGKYKDHLPVIVEVSASIFPKATADVHAAGTRVMTDVFTTDVGVKLGQPPSRYLPLYDQGAEILQSDLPDLVLTAIGRPPSGT